MRRAAFAASRLVLMALWLHIVFPVAAQPATRVVALAPSLTEMVFAAGAGDKLVGVSAFSDFPVAARKLPQVADASGIAWESLLALKPDLVLAWKSGTRPADIARLESLGLPVAIIEIRRLSDVPASLRLIGKRLGHGESAESAAGVFERAIEKLRQTNRSKQSVRSFIEISAKPVMTVNRDHVLSELLAICGGENAFADAVALVSEPSREAMMQRSIDVILRAASSPANNRDLETYRGLAAHSLHRIYPFTADFAFRPGPRLLLAAEEICKGLDRARANLAAVPGH
jgi:iron complex transport system substrate-binding protein